MFDNSILYCDSRGEALSLYGSTGAEEWDRIHSPPKPPKPIAYTMIQLQYPGKKPFFWAMTGTEETVRKELSNMFPAGYEIIHVDVGEICAQRANQSKS